MHSLVIIVNNTVLYTWNLKKKRNTIQTQQLAYSTPLVTTVGSKKGNLSLLSVFGGGRQRETREPMVNCGLEVFFLF